MCTLVNRPSTPENLAHGLQSPTELPCKVSNCLYCPGSLVNNVKHFHSKNQGAQWSSGIACISDVVTLQWVDSSAMPCWHIATHLHYTVLVCFDCTWSTSQHEGSMLLKLGQEVFCFPQLGHLAYNWWASAYRSLVNVTVWKCPLALG